MSKKLPRFPKVYAWVHGSIVLYDRDDKEVVVWVQQTSLGWFAKVEGENEKFVATSGPWENQQQAERSLSDALFRIGSEWES